VEPVSSSRRRGVVISSFTLESFWDIMDAGTEEATLTSLPLRFGTLDLAVDVDMAVGFCF